MNSHEFYERQAAQRPHRPPRTDPAPPSSQRIAFDDPSVRMERQGKATEVRSRNGTRWVQPSDAPASGMRLVGRVVERGFDAQASAGRTAARGARRVVDRVRERRAIAAERRAPSSSRSSAQGEGLGL